MADPQKPILELTTQIEGQPVRIDGVLYQIKNPDVLTLKESFQLRQLGPRLLEQIRAAQTSPKRVNETQLKRDLSTFCHLVLEAPPSVHRKLGVLLQIQVATAFMQLRLEIQKNRRTGATTNNTRRSTTETSSRGSRASMEGRRRTGSIASRSH